MQPMQHLAALWTELGWPASALDCVRLTGADPVLPSSFAVGTAAQVTIAASALAAASIWQERGGRPQTVGVDMRHAATEFNSEHWLSIEGKPPHETWDKIAGTYQCGDAGCGCIPTCRIIAPACWNC
jgi:crotonobetainyl-CoA:carnitine CoA-transferase CaiB-like acyl-CoA transferase